MIQNIPVKQIMRAEYNPRHMPDSEMEALMRSLATFGFVEPIVVNKRTEAERTAYILVGGHQRLTAVERMIAAGNPPTGIEKLSTNDWVIPAMVVELDHEAEQALNLALNKIRGAWDERKLGEIIINLKDATVLPATGFREDEISRILDNSLPETIDGSDGGQTEPSEPRSKPGEVYELGPHRLVCGDSTDPAVLQKLLGEEKAAMLWSDPPYNVAYKSRGGGIGEGWEVEHRERRYVP